MVPFHLSDSWFDGWFEAYHGGRGRFLPVGAGKLHYVLERRGPLRAWVARGAANLQSPYFDLAGAGAEAAADLPERLFEATGADLIEFDYVAAAPPRGGAAPGWRERFRTSVEPTGRTALIDCSGSYEAWLAGRPKSIRKNWARCQRQLDRLGVGYELVTGAAEAERHAAEMLDVEASGWKGAAGSAIRNRREDELFYTGLVRRSAEAGALHLAFLRHEGRAIAFDFGIVSGGACLVLKASYREEYARYSAGHLVSLRHVRDMFDHGPPIYDMLGNGMTPHPYKLRFATHYRLFHRIRIFAPTPRASLLRRSYQALATARAVRKRLRQSRGGR